MKSLHLQALLALLFVQVIISQTLPGCLNHNGEVVDWFLIYYTPGTVHKHFPLYGYMYIDSTSTNETFDIYKGWGDQSDGPLGLTIAQAEKHKLQSIAWNDQLYQNQGHGNSERAHSKFFMSLKSKSNGFAVVHSTPKYPFFTEEGAYSPPQINPSQKDKAQHFLCMTIRGKETADKILENSCVIKPNIYHNSLKYQCKNTKTQDTFLFQNYNIGKTVFKAVYKNGDKTADIFTQAITNLVESSIVIETFGSPRPFPPACKSHYTVGNTNEIVISEGVRWTQFSDHSKYAYALDNDNVCFGDLNRNTQKQEERGGSFYCFESPYVNGALKGINPEHAGC